MTHTLLVFVFLFGLAAPATVAGAVTPAAKCVAAKNQLVGSYANCRHRALARAVRKGEAPDFSKCESKFADKWVRAEKAAAGACPSSADAGAIGTLVDTTVTTISTAIDGDGIPACGDGAINAAGEVCDGTDFGGTSCGDLGWIGGNLACTSDCRFDATGCRLCPDSGRVIGGFCWVLGDEGASCDATCDAAGLVYDAATRTYAGSDEPFGSNCNAILDAFGLSWDLFYEFYDFLPAVGCAHNAGADHAALVVSPPTTGAASQPGYRRACACRALP